MPGMHNNFIMWTRYSCRLVVSLALICVIFQINRTDYCHDLDRINFNQSIRWYIPSVIVLFFVNKLCLHDIWRRLMRFSCFFADKVRFPDADLPLKNNEVTPLDNKTPCQQLQPGRVQREWLCQIEQPIEYHSLR